MRLTVDIRQQSYDDLEVLRDVGFAVEEGEVVCLIGPSGCGKSTLLGLVGGLIRPTDGRVCVEGALPAGSLNPVTYVFQDFALLPWRSVAANVAFPLEHHRLSAAERDALVADALARTGLTEFRDAVPKQLSGGMRQRVGIARALVVKPAILLLDEPLSALDAQTRELLMEDFLDLWLRERITALYVTHNLDEALRLADRVVVLSRRPGRIKEIVAIGIPQRDRASAAAAARIASLREHLWSLIRGEAAIAEREMAHV
ncbi:MAG: nitrate transporter ATP-binding protein [Enterovirga sp.]|jgi:NitT/TauT family transport system ATP-binding protein|nr:nitrate transporter ATP-binding protein [Enterovirga sp.]